VKRERDGCWDCRVPDDAAAGAYTYSGTELSGSLAHLIAAILRLDLTRLWPWVGVAMQVFVLAEKTQFSEMADTVELGERLVIARNGAPAAEPSPARMQIGGLKDKVKPPPEDTFASMDASELAAWNALCRRSYSMLVNSQGR
jgi:antitoxin (DNA-binding transcriptional repressor) of toxin-antitoxin stability system